MEFNEFVTSMGFDVESLSDVQRTSLQGAWRKQNADPNDRGDDGGGKRSASEGFDDAMAKFKAEDHRIKRVTTLVSEAVEANPNRLDELEAIGKQAISGKWNETQTELALLRAARPGSPSIAGSGRTAQASAIVLEAALAQATGLQNATVIYGEKAMEAAHRQFRGGLGIQQLLAIAAGENGYRGTCSVKSNLKEVMRYAFEPKATAGFSNVSIGGILSNVANKFSREGFMGVESGWRDISSVRPVTDYKQITTYSPYGDFTFKAVNKAGDLEHATMNETSYTNQARLYGIQFGLTEEDLVNDDLGVLAKTYSKLGRGGANTISETVWPSFMDNGSFFTVGNTNVSTGAGSALGIAGLQAAVTVFKTMKGPDSKYTHTKAKVLVVPTALEVTAWNLMNSVETNATTTANAPIPSRNPFTGMFKVVSSPYLQDSTYTGYSSAAWYLLADPNDVPVMEVCFLNGQDAPLIETAEADFSTLGIRMRATLRFGASKQEPKGGVRSAGS